VTLVSCRRTAQLAKSVEELAPPSVGSVAELLLRSASALREETVIQAGTRLQLERQLIGVPLPVPFESYTEVITSWPARGREARARPDNLLARDARHRPGFRLLRRAAHLLGTQRPGDLMERTDVLIRTIIPSAERDIRLCPSTSLARVLGAEGRAAPERGSEPHLNPG
jgi:hypothetical protein